MSDEGEFVNVTGWDEDGNLETTRRISYDDLPPRLARILREHAARPDDTVALPDFPDQPGRVKVRFAPEAALKYLDLKEQAEDERQA
jgi:hypothetical protein